ncbi:MAG: 6-phosphofructokinase [Planctomycetota bacterium]
MSTLVGNAVIGQSGGPTAVINQSLVGCVQELQGASQVERVLGARHAVAGIVAEDFLDLTGTPNDLLERIAATPSSALGSSRDKPDAAYCQRIFTSLQKHNVRYFFYIGGNDSSDTCRIVNEVAKEKGHELRAFHIAKTIDNDLVHNDHTPGFGSAARFVACAFMGDNLDNKALAGIKINIVMGRHAGFLTAASLLARQRPGDGPHLIYVPEVAFDADRFIADVDRCYKEHGRCLIAVSEGIHDASGEPMATKLAKDVEKDAHGNVQLSGSGALGDFLVQLIKERLGNQLRVRADTFGYLQRCFPGCISEVDQQEAREGGRAAARAALSGEHSEGSIAIQRVSNNPYSVEYKRLELTDVAAKTQVLADKYLAGTNDIDESFREYVLPLVGELPVIEQF